MFSNLIYQQCPISAKHYMARSERISAVVIHYAAAIVRDGADVVKYWETKDYTSANYIIDVQGRITGVVPEELRPFTSGSFGRGSDDIDNRAITIECSCDNAEYHVSRLTIDALCELMGDIGSRYGIWWKFTGDKTGNVHAHKWYEYTPCPGEYLYSKFDFITDVSNYIIYKQEEMKLSEIEERLDTLESHTLPAYHSLEDIPDYWQKEVSWCIYNGYLKGDPSGDLNLSYDELRSLVVAARMVMAP